MAYIDAHPDLVGPELGGKFLVNINMDMVGEHLELLHSKLIITRTPASLPSAVNDVVENMAEMVDRMNIRTPRGSRSAFNYRVTPYSGGSDHMMFIERKIPGIMLSHSPDYTHHTSEDTPDKVDPVQLERCEIISAGAMWYLANLNTSQAIDLIYLVKSNASKRIGIALRRAYKYLESDPDGGWPTAQNVIRKAYWQEVDVLSSILTFNSAEVINQMVDDSKKQLESQYRNILIGLRKSAIVLEVNMDGMDVKTDDRIPFRTTRGPLDFNLPESELGEDKAAWYRSDEFLLNNEVRMAIFINNFK